MSGWKLWSCSGCPQTRYGPGCRPWMESPCWGSICLHPRYGSISRCLFHWEGGQECYQALSRCWCQATAWSPHGPLMAPWDWMYGCALETHVHSLSIQGSGNRKAAYQRSSLFVYLHSKHCGNLKRCMTAILCWWTDCSNYSGLDYYFDFNVGYFDCLNVH